MKVIDIINSVEEQVQNPITRQIPVDHLILLDWLAQEINTLSGMAEFDFLMQRLDPLLLTEVGKRNYLLPEDFPENFVHGGDDQGEEYMCKINNGTSEAFLTYQEPAQYFSRTLEDEASAKPSDYTIMTGRDGERELWLGPPPDSNSDANYNVSGLYIPTDWNLTDETQVPPIPANAGILRYALLRRIEPQNQVWFQEYERHRSQLLLRAARSKPQLCSPSLGNTVDRYALGVK